MGAIPRIEWFCEFCGNLSPTADCIDCEDDLDTREVTVTDCDKGDECVHPDHDYGEDAHVVEIDGRA